MKSRVRWFVRYGLTGSAVRSGLRSGDLQARLAADPAVRVDPYATYAEIRERGPLVASRFALLSARHDVVSEILRNPDFRVGYPAEATPRPLARALEWAEDPRAVGPIEPPSMIAVDGADHARQRRLVGKAFTARAVEALRADVQRIAEELLGRLDPSQPFELVDSYAALLPAQVIAGLLGIPPDMREAFMRWGQDMTPQLDIEISYRDFRRSEAALRELNAWLPTHFARLRQEPGADLISRVIVAGLAEDGPALTDAELTTVAGLVLLAGFETAVNLIGNAVVLLLAHPEQLAELRAEPAGWTNAVEEVLRYESPVQNTERHAARDVKLYDIDVTRNQFVTLLLGAANRDPKVFTDPDTFDIRRPNAREHLAFSAGAHFCLGAALARAEAEIGLRALFDRFPNLRPAGDPVRKPSRVLRGWAQVPVRGAG